MKIFSGIKMSVCFRFPEIHLNFRHQSVGKCVKCVIIERNTYGSEKMRVDRSRGC